MFKSDGINIIIYFTIFSFVCLLGRILMQEFCSYFFFFYVIVLKFMIDVSNLVIGLFL